MYPERDKRTFGMNKRVELSITQDGLLIKNPEYTLVKTEKELIK